MKTKERINDNSISFQEKESISKKGQTKTREYSSTSIHVDYMGIKKNYEIIIKKKNKEQEAYEIVTYKNDRYEKFYCQTFSLDSQRMCEYLDKHFKDNELFQDLSEVIIAKYESLHGISAYDHVTNKLYISEELIDSNKFKKIVDENYFVAKNLNDILIHELDGHKRHWDAIKRFQMANHIHSIEEAKQELESELRIYVKNAVLQDKTYLLHVFSQNVFEGYSSKQLENGMDNRLNELIADGKVLIERNMLKDENVENLIEEVLYYDENAK